MALYKSHLVTQASGSVGGTTYSHSKGGLYMRARSVPVNPNTTLQSQVRAALTNNVVRWTEVLTPAERAAWEVYAANTPTVNRLGDQIFLSGQNMYVRTGTVLGQLQAKLGLGTGLPSAVAPAIFNLGDFTTPTLPIADVVTGLQISVTSADAWANAGDNFMLLFQGRPMNAARNYFRGPWRLVGAVEGDAAPPTVLTVTAADVAARGFPLVAGQLTNFTVAVVRDDGRLSSRRNLGNILVTP